MNRCERCRKIIWPWKQSFDFHFGDFYKHLCADCMIPVLDTALSAMLEQRNFFLEELTNRVECVKMFGAPLLKCEKLQIEDKIKKQPEICARCWCEAARKKASQNE